VQCIDEAAMVRRLVISGMAEKRNKLVIDLLYLVTGCVFAKKPLNRCSLFGKETTNK
jgi:ribulose kinase